MILIRYIAGHLLRGWLMALLVLAPVFAVIGFIQELERARLDYDGLAVARYTLMVLPQQMISLAPVIALLGSMAALSGLNRSNQLTVISGAGFPPSRLLLAVAFPTALLVILLWLAMEFVTPRLQTLAEQQRYDLRYRDEVVIPQGGIWSVAGRRFTRLGAITRDGTPRKIDIFEFDEDGQLVMAVRAGRAEVQDGRRWLLRNVRLKSLEKGEFVTRRLRELEIERLWNVDELPTLTLSVDTMSLSILYSYCKFLSENGQPVERYQALFWQKLLTPLTVAAMVLLAVPMSAGRGSGRDRSVGASLGIGAFVGILFYLAAQIIHALGRALDFSLLLVALLPGLIILVLALVLFRRMSW